MWRERDKFVHLSPSHSAEDGGGRVEAGAAVLALHYWDSCTKEEGDTSHIRYTTYDPPIQVECLSLSIIHSEAFLSEPEALVVVGHSAIVVLDPNTLQATDSLDLRGTTPFSLLSYLSPSPPQIPSLPLRVPLPPSYLLLPPPP